MTMKYISCFVLLFILINFVFGQTHILYLPYTCTVPGTYVLDGNLSSTSGGITIGANGVVLNLSSYSITYGTSSAGYGITWSANRTGCEIYNGTLIQGAAGGDPIYTNIYGSTNMNIH